MSAKQYEDYLVQCFIDWVEQEIQPGFRYHFKSPDSQNALKLYRAFLARIGGDQISFSGHQLPCIDCGGVQLIPVLHGTEEVAYSENYISHLRDKVASRSAEFSRSAMLFIHNSMLDTLINSAMDVAAPGGAWHPSSIERKLSELICTGSDNEEVSRSLLQDQLAIITEEGATVFGFGPLFYALADGVLDFPELGLFNDPLILNMKGQSSQIRHRLDENRALRREMEFSVEHYSDQLDSVLTKFSQKFIREHFEDKKDWQNLDLEVFLDEIKANKSQKLILESINIIGADWHQRTKSNTKAGQKEISLAIQVAAGTASVEIELVFLGNDLEQSQLKLLHNKTLAKDSEISVNRAGGKYSRAKLKVPYTDNPSFFSVELRRDNRAEEYKLRCLIIEKDLFYFDDIKTCFRVEPQREQLTLQLEENQFKVSASGDAIYRLDEDGVDVDCRAYAYVDFEPLANQSEMIRFKLCNGVQVLPINVEGPGAEEGVIIPLLFDLERVGKLLSDEGNAEYNRAKRKIIVDNSEHSAVGVRQQLLEFEALMVDQRALCVDDSSESYYIHQMSQDFPELYKAYYNLFDYLERYRTLPSLAAWGENYCSLVQSVLDAFEHELKAIPLSQVLTRQQKDLLKVGMYKNDGREWVSPIHPLVLSYHQHLVSEVRSEHKKGSVSYYDLPTVTLDRLVASGLLPFVYHRDSDFAQLVPVKENSFWLEIIPQRKVSHSFVRRLVKDKLIEFTKAYSRLFPRGESSALIVNAINQGRAEELFLGLVDYFKLYRENALAIHVNFYDDQLQQNDFDKFAEMGGYEKLKDWLGLNSGALRADADVLIDQLRSFLTYSKFVSPSSDEALAYAHLSFFSNNAPVEYHQIDIDQALSGVLCDGLIAGEAAETKGEAYFTSFGLRNVETSSHQSLRLARLLGSLWQPAHLNNSHYLGYGMGLAVSTDFKRLLTQSYDSALWTTIIDPKVTLDFFTSQKDVVLIHYSDQYTSSAGYDAITVTKQIDLFQRLLLKESNVKSDRLLAEFNSFNGEWLLKMLTATPKDRKEKHGIIGAYKFVSAMLAQSDICWVPLSVAEMIRVSGNVGLKMSDSDFSRHLHGYRKGAISDDVLFVGFKDQTLYLLPLEVKTGARPDFKYAGQQAKELKRYLHDDVLGPDTLEARLYRALFIRQVLIQVEKFRLYHVLTDDKLETLINNREWWQRGVYQVDSVPGYVDGIILAHVEGDTFFEPNYQTTDDNILQIELPYALLPTLIGAEGSVALGQVVDACKLPSEYFLKPNSSSAQHDTFDKEKGGVIKVIETVSLKNSEYQVSITDNKNILPSDIKNNLKVLIGHDAIRQTPFYWEPTNTARFMNTNTGIIGTMGTGKTQFTKSLVTQLIQNQAHNVNCGAIGMLIFDYKSDYVDNDFIRVNSANRLRLYRLPYNPLSLYGDMPLLPVHTATSFAETMAKAFGLGQKQQLRLRKLILDAYDLAGINKADATTWSRPAPTIAQLWDLFLDQEKVEEDSLYAALDSLAAYEIFESNPQRVSSLYDLIQGVTVIELAGYSPQIQNLIVALTLDLFYSQMQKRGKPLVEGDYRQLTKMILVDEADNFMKEDFDSLRKILKEGREYGVGVILSTQEITHFKTGENNYASYILTWIVHRVAEIRNADIKAIFNKDDKGEQDQLMESIRKLDKHFSLYIDGEKRVQKMRDRAFWELLSAQGK
ncbi:DNA phosphorothioation-dependent restriction protein DptH [Pseudomonas panipatensis]|uniref:DNA phosphorothioation-dependent restriction protein DptH n=1 Tax=Pseudomonas panipatensis TaxID=428992 RepID=A0A1G8G4U5_9PSED|nr:DNA phosphorothioation-dependent restriction protein DptH [Pseudomonas panipatensis]SDH89389.1 DNA phosphorothioation-dependent restriction protein DptH [Pseudomonas panipatensis]SMP45364.1 DNA phosphorothioation-dependent restriction protein DptH [Pseudomonas panipatensis]